LGIFKCRGHGTGKNKKKINTSAEFRVQGAHPEALHIPYIKFITSYKIGLITDFRLVPGNKKSVMFMRRRIAIVVFVIIVYQIISAFLTSRAEKQRHFLLEKVLQDERNHEHTRTAEFTNFKLFPSRQFYGTDSTISGHFVQPPIGVTSGMPYDVLAEFKAIWIGIDGEAEVYKLCDIYSDGKLPKMHGQFPVNVPIKRKDVKQEGNKLTFNILSGHEIKRYGSFELCIYDPEAKGLYPNDKPGRYVYSGLKTGVSVWQCNSL
jgi:hypothetical protein